MCPTLFSKASTQCIVHLSNYNLPIYWGFLFFFYCLQFTYLRAHFGCLCSFENTPIHNLFKLVENLIWKLNIYTFLKISLKCSFQLNLTQSETSSLAEEMERNSACQSGFFQSLFFQVYGFESSFFQGCGFQNETCWLTQRISQILTCCETLNNFENEIGS